MRTISRSCFGVLLAAVLLPASAWALGFGDIRLKSALNAPLDAEIEISGTREELGSVRAGLASREQFARNGMEYPAFLNTATVRLAKTADGHDVLLVRTTDPVTEPFLTMLVQVSYARGQLIREYTVLLDPPVFAGQSSAPVISAPSTGSQARTGDLERSAGPAAPAAAPAPVRSYRVQPGDTLSSIARTQYPDVNREAALVGLYRANRAAFDGNMNSLQRGSLLTLPAEGDLARVAPAEARTEVGRQYRDWADQRGAGRLRLVPPAESAAQPAAAGQPASDLQRRVAELEQQLAEKERLLSLRSAELARLQQRSGAATSAPVAPTAPAATPPPAPSSASSAPPAVVTPPPVATPRVTPKPAAKPAPVSAPESESSVLDWIMGYWYVAVAAVALLAALGLFLRGRRARQDAYGDRRLDHFGAAAGAFGESSQTLPARQLPDAADSIVVEETGSHRPEGAESQLPAPTISVSDDGAAVSETPAAAESGTGLDQGDPLAEADFHMAYGLYDQAAELVSQTIAREPERRELKLKLLEVYFVWGNKQKFEQLAAELAATRSGAVPGEWEKIVIMGRQIAPENPLFALAGSVAAASGSVDLNLEGGQNRIDFNLMGEPSMVPGDDVDLDLGDAMADLPGMEAGSRPPGESGVDFLLDTPVRGEGGELHTQMMPATSNLHALRERVGQPTEGPTAELPQLDVPEQGTIRMKLEGPAARPAGSDTKENTAELALDDLGLDLGTMEAHIAGADQAGGEEEEIILQTGGELLPDLESGPEGNWLLQGTEDSAEHPALGADGTPGTAELARPEQDPGHGLLAAEIDAALSGMPLPDSGGTTSGHVEPLSRPDLATQEMAPAGELLSGLAASNAITAVMPSPESQYSAAGATSRLASLGLTDSDIDTQIGGTRAMPVAPAVLPEMDPPTMSEVGTKLDLARAYMDMGDPEGARSILDEVLTEGSASQKQEARRLIESLPG